MTVAVPAAAALTSPEELTVAADVLLDVHDTARPVSTFPLASRSVAVSCWLWPIATVAADGAITTLATGAGGAAAIVSAAVPLRVSLVAVMVDVPAATPVTSPAALTVATPVLLDDQATLRPVRTFPLASRSVAVSCCPWPTVTVAVDGAIETLATGAGGIAVVVRLELPLFPSLVAVIVEVPAAMPVTRPDPFTVAALVLLDDQVMVRPDSTFPFASFETAVSCVVAPACTLAALGDTATDATATGGGAETVNGASPDIPSLDAAIVAVPAETAVTSPMASTVDIRVFELCQEIVRPVNTAPCSSFSVATAVCA